MLGASDAASGEGAFECRRCPSTQLRVARAKAVSRFRRRAMRYGGQAACHRTPKRWPAVSNGAAKSKWHPPSLRFGAARGRAVSPSSTK